jgi:RNA recognition motif-containing protein
VSRSFLTVRGRGLDPQCANVAEWFRLFVGDVSNDVNERTLDEAFSKYPSYCKSKVVRDRLSEKVSRTPP